MDLKQRVEEVLRFDADYIAQLATGGFVSLQTKEQRTQALKHIVNNMQEAIKELSEREAKLVERINKLQELNDMSVPQAYENGYNLALKRVKNTLAELGITETDME